MYTQAPSLTKMWPRLNLDTFLRLKLPSNPPFKINQGEAHLEYGLEVNSDNSSTLLLDF